MAATIDGVGDKALKADFNLRLVARTADGSR
jgi:hypothetical protein